METPAPFPVSVAPFNNGSLQEWMGLPNIAPEGVGVTPLPPGLKAALVGIKDV